MLFTQNIDCLERAAGVPAEKVIEAHGSFASQRCIDCKTEYPDEFMRAFVESGDIPHCEDEACQGLVKPDITFFGEALPAKFHDNTHVPSQADLMIIIGTSLSVHPFAALPDMALDGTPRVLLNMERVGSLGSRPDDVLLLGDCDGQVRRLADELGWRDELEELYKEVGGPGASREPVPASEKQDALEDEIEKLTSEVDHALKLSNGHKSWLEKHLAKKSASGAPIEVVPEVNDEKPQTQDIQTSDVEEQTKEPSTDQISEVGNPVISSPELESNSRTSHIESSALKETENKATTSSTPAEPKETTEGTASIEPQTDTTHPIPPGSEPST
jgi:NAD-dependent histone deacetylase SIR2